MTSGFKDSVPPEMRPITDSDWNRLDEAGKADYLRRHNAIALDRHRELRQGQAVLVEGQKQIVHKASTQALALKLQADASRKIVTRLDVQELSLAENTEATKRTEEKVDKLTADTATLVKLFQDAEGFFSVIGRISDAGKRLAWVAIPFMAAAGAYKAATAWISSKGF